MAGAPACLNRQAADDVSIRGARDPVRRPRSNGIPRPNMRRQRTSASTNRSPVPPCPQCSSLCALLISGEACARQCIPSIPRPTRILIYLNIFQTDNAFYLFHFSIRPCKRASHPGRPACPCVDGEDVPGSVSPSGRPCIFSRGRIVLPSGKPAHHARIAGHIQYTHNRKIIPKTVRKIFPDFLRNHAPPRRSLFGTPTSGRPLQGRHVATP